MGVIKNSYSDDTYAKIDRELKNSSSIDISKEQYDRYKKIASPGYTQSKTSSKPKRTLPKIDIDMSYNADDKYNGEFGGEEYAEKINQAAFAYDVNPFVLASIAYQESRFDPKAVGKETSYGTAKGMYQFIDSTAKDYNVKEFDVDSSINGAAWMIRDLKKQYDGDFSSIMAGYNWGGDQYKKFLNGEIDMPDETFKYIIQVSDRYNKYKKKS